MTHCDALDILGGGWMGQLGKNDASLSSTSVENFDTYKNVLSWPNMLELPHHYKSDLPKKLPNCSGQDATKKPFILGG